MPLAERAGHTIHYEEIGDRGAPPLLLIMGLGLSSRAWETLPSRLSERFRVLVFDNRGTGRSGRAGWMYRMRDLADDAVTVLDAVGVGRADVFGISMGGMIAQALAIRHPERVLSLVSIMSTTGNRRVGWTHPFLWRRLFRRRPLDRDGYVRDFIATYREIGSRRYPPGDERTAAMAERCFERGIHPRGAARQLMAIASARDRTSDLGSVRVPTTVIHGTDDRLVMPSGGRATAAAIPDARLVEIDGMAHDLPPALWDRVIDEIAATAARA